ncbi:MAG: hypothetical protein WKF87_04230 [Chryseolinea sp.]
MKFKLQMSAIIITTCFNVFSATAQEFSLKKDVILKDKVPYANITGESSMLKDTDLLVSSLNGDPLFTIKAWKYPTGNPAYKELTGVKIEFKASGHSLIRTRTAYAKGKLVEEIFHFWTDLIVNNAIDPKAEADYISKFDNNEVMLAQLYEKTEAEYLKNMEPIKRDTTAAIDVKVTSQVTNKDGSITQETEIYQGGVYLASTHKLWTSEWEVAFYRKVDVAMEVNDTATKKIQITTLTIPGMALSQGVGNSFLFVNRDIAVREIKISAPKECEKQIVRYLTKLGYL